MLVFCASCLIGLKQIVSLIQVVEEGSYLPSKLLVILRQTVQNVNVIKTGELPIRQDVFRGFFVTLVPQIETLR